MSHEFRERLDGRQFRFKKVDAPLELNVNAIQVVIEHGADQSRRRGYGLKNLESR